MDPILDDLTPEQHAAVTHVDGPLIVVAGPGSGKTRVISRRVAFLVDRHGAPASSVLAITFTNKAAEEMRVRISKILGGESRVYVSTFHSFCARMLRHYGPVGRTTGYTIYDADDQRACVKRIITGELKLDDKQWRAGAVLARISDAKSRRESAEQFDAHATSFADRTIAKIYKRYEQFLTEYNALDFDDLLLAMLDVLEQRPEVLAEMRERFKYVLVDEYQDTNRPQYDMANLLAGKDGNLCVVGDPDQSIYKWRGADIRNILDFEKDHPHTRVVKLERNYRSTKRILAAAQGVIANNIERREKTLFTENADGEPVRLVRCLSDDEEARLIAESVRRRLDDGVPPVEIAIFYRTNALSRKFEEELRARGVRHVVIGAVPFFQRKEVKDVLSFLRVRANPHDEQSVRRAIVFAEGFGQKTLERIAAFAAATGRPLVEAILAVEEVTEVRAKQRESVREFAAILSGLEALPPSPVGDLLREVVDRTGARQRLLKSDDPQDWSRAENIEALVNGGYEFDQRTPDGDYKGFLDQAALLAGTDPDKDATDAVRLMTLHSAKGLEFDEVYIAGVDGGILPLERDLEDCDIEEERRLFYVGLTRARKRVTLTSSAVRRTYGQEKAYPKSRFVKEIPVGALETTGGGRYADAEAVGAKARKAKWDDGADPPAPDDDDFLDPDRARARARARSVNAPAARIARDSAPASFVPVPVPVPVPDSPRGQPAANERDLRVGDRVDHAIFGRGDVLLLQGDGLGRRIRVRFDRAGEKLLVLHYANLKRVV